MIEPLEPKRDWNSYFAPIIFLGIALGSAASTTAWQSTIYFGPKLGTAPYLNGCSPAAKIALCCVPICLAAFLFFWVPDYQRHMTETVLDKINPFGFGIVVGSAGFALSMATIAPVFVLARLGLALCGVLALVAIGFKIFLIFVDKRFTSRNDSKDL